LLFFAFFVVFSIDLAFYYSLNIRIYHHFSGFFVGLLQLTVGPFQLSFTPLAQTSIYATAHQYVGEANQFPAPSQTKTLKLRFLIGLETYHSSCIMQMTACKLTLKSQPTSAKIYL